MQLRSFAAWVMVAPLLALPTVTEAQTVSNPSTAPDCMNNTAFFNPKLPPSINLPPGFTASVFASGLNVPTGIAFLGNASSFQVFVLESGHGIPSQKLTQLIGLGRPPGTQNAHAFKRLAEGGFPFIEKVVQNRIEILVGRVPRQIGRAHV